VLQLPLVGRRTRWLRELFLRQMSAVLV
jgi:hypothetical protein